MRDLQAKRKSPFFSDFIDFPNGNQREKKTLKGITLRDNLIKAEEKLIFTMCWLLVCPENLISMVFPCRRFFFIFLLINFQWLSSSIFLDWINLFFSRLGLIKITFAFMNWQWSAWWGQFWWGRGVDVETLLKLLLNEATKYLSGTSQACFTIVFTYPWP